MSKPVKAKYRKKAEVSLIGNKLSEIDPIIAKRLKKLNEDLFSTTIDDIRKGKAQDETLRALCGMISHKMKKHPEFKNTVGIYIAEALNDISNGMNAQKAFRLGNKTATGKINDFNLNVAYAVWQEIKFSKKKALIVFMEAAEKYNKTESHIRKIYYENNKNIDKKYKATEKCSL